MVSTNRHGRTRKTPERRRAEIISAAAGIAVTDGLEKVTLRTVASAVGVRPGLVSHYFPAAEELVAMSFTEGMQKLQTCRAPGQGGSTYRLLAFIDEQVGAEAGPVMSLWISGRNLSRHSAAIGMAVEEVDEADRRYLVGVIAEGIATGDYPDVDPMTTAIRILMGLDGYGVYTNCPLPFAHHAYTGFALDVAEWALGLTPGSLRSAYERMDLSR